MRTTATVTLLTVLALGGGVVACEDDPIIVEPETFGATLMPEGDVVTEASGSASFVLDDGVVTYSIEVADITGVTAAHIHGPAGVNENAGVIVGLFAGPEGGTGAVNGELASGTFTAADITASGIAMDSLLVLMRTGQSYVNVHTVANPPGEIRGQIIGQ